MGSFFTVPKSKGDFEIENEKKRPAEDPIEKGDPKIKSYYIKTIKKPN